jgi:hypothetical protein
MADRVEALFAGIEATFMERMVGDDLLHCSLLILRIEEDVEAYSQLLSQRELPAQGISTLLGHAFQEHEPFNTLLEEIYGFLRQVTPDYCLESEQCLKAVAEALKALENSLTPRLRPERDCSIECN